MERRSSFGAYLIGIYLFSVPVFAYSGKLGLNVIPQIIGVFLTCYAFYDLTKVRQFPKNRALILYFLFTIWSITCYFFAEYQFETETLFTLIKVTIITLSVASLIKNQSDFYISLSIFFISVFMAVILNIKDILAISNLNEITDNERFAGTFANANTAALYCLAIIWTGFLLLFKQNQSFFFKVLILAGLTLAGLLIIYSGSRKGLLGLGLFSVGLGYFIIKMYGNTALRKIFFIIVVLAGLVTTFLLIYTSPFFYRVLTIFKHEASSDERIYLFTKAINLWSSSLKYFIFGVGVDNFQFYNELKVYSHSTISETLVCTGIVGFGLYFASLFSIFSTYLKVFRKIIYDEKISIIFVLIFLILLLFFNSTAVMLSDRLFWPMLGIISSHGILIDWTIQNEEVGIKVL